jgi:hypothetical protein
MFKLQVLLKKKIAHKMTVLNVMFSSPQNQPSNWSQRFYNIKIYSFYEHLYKFKMSYRILHIIYEDFIFVHY